MTTDITNERFHQLVTQHLADVLLVLDEDDRFIWASPSIERVLGYRPEDALGKRGRDFVPPEDDQRVMRERSAAGGPVTLRFRVRCADGTIKWMSTVSTPVDLGDGRHGRVSAMRDVTAEVEAEEARRMTEEKLRVLAEVSSDVVVEIDLDGNTAAVTERVTELLGWDPAELVGRSPFDFVHPDDLALVVAGADELRGGQPVTVTVRCRVKAGGWRWIAVRTGVLRDHSGEPTGFVAGWRDVEGEMQAMDALTVAETRSRLLAEITSDVIVHVSQDRRLTWVSPSVSRVLGWDPEELIGLDPDDLAHPDDVARIDSIEPRLQGGTPGSFTVRLRSSTGAYRWFQVKAAPIEFADGRPTTFIAGWRDVNREVEAREALQASEARYRMLAENASDVVLLSDADRRMSWVSSTVTHTLGWAPEDLVGHQTTEFIHPDDRISTSMLRERIFEPGPDGPPRETDFLARFRTKDGQFRWMSGIARTTVEAGRLVNVVTGLRDVHDLVTTRLEAERSEALVRVVLDSARDAILTFDRDGRVTYVNAATESRSGLPREAWIGRTLGEVGGYRDVANAYREKVEQVLETRQPLVFEVELERGDDTVWFEAALAPVLAADGSIERVIATNRDITERHRAVLQLADQATHDALTGLANRAALLDELNRSLATSRRSGRLTAVLMLDLDHFKYVNDSLGHAVGDLLLVAAARRLESLVRGGELAARLGGDEFVVVMRDLERINDAGVLAQRIVEAFRQPLTITGTDLYATTSVGIAVSSESSQAADLLREADTALYVAKAQGRDRVTAFNEALRESVTNRLTIGGQLRPALEHSEFEVWYQPEIDLQTGAVLAFEALLRWNHPEGEMYSANQFIDVAEETGVLAEIGDWVLGQACEHAAAWPGSEGTTPVVRVNLSANQLAEPALMGTIDLALARSGLAPARLCLEVTEASLLRGNPTAHENLIAAHERGIGLSIDDFGSGYASLTYLRDLPVSVIKIDRSFIGNLATDERDHRIVAGIVALAGRLGIKVTAEGVEHEDQVAALRDLHCAGGQGYLFARPMPAAEVAGFVATVRPPEPSG